MNCTQRRVDDVVILELEGKFWLGDSIRDVVRELLEAGERRILVDMHGVTYVDSTGVGDLVTCYRNAVEKGAEFKLLRLPGRIRELLEIHHLIGVFDHHEDEDEAVASFTA